MGNTDRLGPFEQAVLLAVIRLSDNAYGMTIRREIHDRTQKDVAIGAVYVCLDRLKKKGFVRDRKGDATPERGGRAKRYFRVTAAGQRALNETREFTDAMWVGLPDPAGA